MAIERIVSTHFPQARIKRVKLLGGGMSETTVAKVTLIKKRGKRKSIVVKFGPKAPKDIRGYGRLKGSPLEGRLPVVFHVGTDYLVMQYIRGVIGTLRQVVVRELMDEDSILDIMRQLLSAKRKLWLRNARGNGASRDILREEFEDTVSRIPRLLRELGSQPIVANGQACISLDEAIGRMRSVLYHQNGGLPVVLSHGDATGGNTLILRSQNWRLVDPEWAGEVDWVASLSRMGKWRSSTVARLEGEASFSPIDGQVELDYRLSVPSICFKLQKLAEDFGSEIAAELGDSSWRERWKVYVAVSLLREIVLLEKRNLPTKLALPLLGDVVRLLS